MSWRKHLIFFTVIGVSAPFFGHAAQSLDTQSGQLQETAPRRAIWGFAAILTQKSLRDNLAEADLTGVTLDGLLSYDILTNLKMRIEARLQLQNGRAQSLFQEPLVENGFVLQEATLEWLPWETVSLKGGNLDHSALNAPLLVVPSFPGAVEAFMLRSGKNYFALELEQAIPNSSNLALSNAEWEPLPRFYLESLVADFDVDSFMRVESRLSHFSYQDLPSSVAVKSGPWGNFLLGEDLVNDQFVSEFRGWHATLSGVIRPSGTIEARVGYNHLINTDAGLNNRGQRAFLKLIVRGAPTWSVEPLIEAFENQANSSPAYYNSADFGHNNRRGQAAGVALKLEPAHVKLSGKFINSDAILPNSYQGPRQEVLLTLEAYDVGL